MTQFACVTGADRGLGFALAEGLLQEGWHVFAGQYRADRTLLDQLSVKYSGKLHVVGMDVSDDHSVRLAANRIGEMTDKLDLIINNAGILGDTDATIRDELSFGEMQHVFNVNTLGPLRVVNALAPLVFRSERKLFVNISSEAGSIGDCERTSWFGYCMSKAALNMQSALIHNEVKSSGGRVLLIHPGWVQSYMHGTLNTQATLPPEVSAGHILERLRELDDTPWDKPLYIDYLGRPLSW